MQRVVLCLLRLFHEPQTFRILLNVGNLLVYAAYLRLVGFEISVGLQVVEHCRHEEVVVGTSVELS